MVHTVNVAAPAAASAARPRRPPLQVASAGSFRAGSPLPNLNSRRQSIRGLRRQSTQYHYQTFPTAPPRNAGRRQRESGSSTSLISTTDDEQHSSSTPLPFRQLALLALLSLAEQTALNSISPYLPSMIGSFEGVDAGAIGLYVGLLASAFALAQLATNLLWGYLSDKIGRKPVMLLGTSLLAICFTAFGFCTRYWHVLIVHVAMGLLNGNAAVVPTCLGELTDRSNQSQAFTWLPVIYSLGSITGPALGGLMVGTIAGDRYPFLAPNILGAAFLAISVVVLAAWFEETLEDEDGSVDWLMRLRGLLGYSKKGLRHSWSSRWPRAGRRQDVSAGGDDEDDDADNHEGATASEDQGLMTSNLSDGDDDEDPKSTEGPTTWRALLNRTTLLLLSTYLVFQLSNISFSSLYPIFASTEEPTGRNLHADVIGVSLSVAGVCTIFFQVFLFPALKAKLGNLGSYRGSLLGLAISMALMPWLGYKDSQPPFGIGDSKIWLYAELGVVLVIKNICAVGGLSSAMLLITNSAPSHHSLGTLQGIAQTLSAAGRSVGPFLSGGLFTLSTHVKPKGEALAWGLFGGIALVGWISSYAIRGDGLESNFDGFEDEDDDYDDDIEHSEDRHH